jgi:hypothetical protein
MAKIDSHYPTITCSLNLYCVTSKTKQGSNHHKKKLKINFTATNTSEKPITKVNSQNWFFSRKTPHNQYSARMTSQAL